jgi:hypothetical protein
VLHLAGVDQLPPPALAEIDAVELSTPFGDAGDEERIAMPASHLEPVTVAPTDARRGGRTEQTVNRL